MDNMDFSVGGHENLLDVQEENVVVKGDHDEEAKILVGDGKNLLVVA